MGTQGFALSYDLQFKLSENTSRQERIHLRILWGNLSHDEADRRGIVYDKCTEQQLKLKRDISASEPNNFYPFLLNPSLKRTHIRRHLRNIRYVLKEMLNNLISAILLELISFFLSFSSI